MNRRLPSWFRQSLPDDIVFSNIDKLCQYKVNTVCKEAKCPNISQCFRDSKMTFMILGDTCTRDCRFCAVNKNSEGKSLELDTKEPLRIARAVKELGLKYAVITSVTRDDLDDGGAEVFALVTELIRNLHRKVKIELLIPDFQGKTSSIERIVKANPDVIGHNIETPERLYPRVRPQADYKRSLAVLKNIKEFAAGVITKSSIILGLGETNKEVRQTMGDLRGARCDIITLGQYLSCGSNNYPVKEFIAPEKFLEYKELAQELGFKAVSSGPLVRSSYRAEKIFEEFSYA